jgi:hypothetical protein
MIDQDKQARMEVARGAQAGELLDNPLIVEALDAYENEIVQLWKTSPLRDVEGREKLRQMLDAATKFRAYMMTTVETGKLAKAQIRDAVRKPGPLAGLFSTR